MLNDISGDTSSGASFAAARGWLDDCISNRKSCSLAGEPTLPTRVLDVSRDPIKLHVTQTQKNSYVCLSHCWGKSPLLRTTLSSYEAHKFSISISSLPKSFQDAIDFTRRLGERYLWIDLLCIIQDSEEGWRLEASRMATIY